MLLMHRVTHLVCVSIQHCSAAGPAPAAGTQLPLQLPLQLLPPSLPPLLPCQHLNAKYSISKSALQFQDEPHVEERGACVRLVQLTTVFRYV